MTRPIVNISELEFHDFGQGERFQAKIGAIGAKIGAQRLGYNVTVVPSGKRAFPFHHHRANEEMFFVLEGTGEVRIGKEHFPIRAGDVIACPPGDAEHAHQIINTSDAELRYLAVSTKVTPELVGYPNTGKFGILAEYPTKDGGKPEQFRFVGRPENSVDYWEGE